MEYRKLGPLSFAEVNVLLCFFLLVGLWFSRDPGFMPGWQSITLRSFSCPFQESVPSSSNHYLISVTRGWFCLLK